jgi:hypothetical protein
MARRVSLPSADDLFRATEAEKAKAEVTGGPGKVTRSSRAAVHAVPDQPQHEDRPDAGALRRPSGRVKHDEKMTVYVTSKELVELEHARLALRSEHGLVVDRGRLVREAMALVLADLELNGEASALVRRLIEE